MSRRDVERDAMGEAMLQMGAIVALSSDLYSSLPHARSSDSQVHRDLAYLMDELLSLDGQLGEPGGLPGHGLPDGAHHPRLQGRVHALRLQPVAISRF